MRAIPFLIPMMLLASCSAPPEGGDSVEEEAAGAGQTASDSSGSDIVFAESGWLVVGEDGAVYTTMLDPDGTYRDFRDGEALDTGTWQKRDDGELCFTPAKEGRTGECWALGKLEEGGTVRATADSGLETILTRVAYNAPDDSSEADGE